MGLKEIFENKEASELIKREYTKGTPVAEISMMLFEMGLESRRGFPNPTARISSAAHALGCERRRVRGSKIKTVQLPDKKITASNFSSNLSEILAIAASNLPEKLKNELLAPRIKS